MIKQLTAKHPLKMLCQHLNVSVSGYLAYQQKVNAAGRDAPLGDHPYNNVNKGIKG